MTTRLTGFDLLESPLEGVNVIEASAGTGKTYTISGLFLRLILEKHLSVNQILVVTFTKAATQELRDRIRRNLREAKAAFTLGHSEESFLSALVDKQADRDDAVRYLDDALRNFDEAAIFTIHGFCQRMLKENAFESGSLFDTELITEQEALKQEIVDDFWRRWFYQASPLFIYYAMENGFTPDTFLGILGNYLAFLPLKIIPRLAAPDTLREEEAFHQAFAELSRTWNASRDAVGEMLKTHPGLNRSSYRAAAVAKLVEAMDDLTASGVEKPGLFKDFGKFTLSAVRKGTKKNHEPPHHQFFERAEVLHDRSQALCRVYGEKLLALRMGLFDYAKTELPKRKARQNLHSFDDLLLKLHEALQGEAGAELAGVIRKRYCAGLIDEFQDTDPVQYAIFSAVFEKEERTLFLIGDPKQAIYSFRGADVFAYLEATRHLDSAYTLKENWRSAPGLITAINTLFSRAEQPFIADEIRFTKAVAGKDNGTGKLIIRGEPDSPFHLWYLPVGSQDQSLLTRDGRFIKKPDAQAQVAKSVGAEIARLLRLGRENNACIGDRGVEEADIAVLVRKNQEARLMQQVLSGLGIPSVLYSEANLFESHEAMEMERVLGGIAEPNNERLLRAALATDMIGVSGEVLERARENAGDWEGWLRKFTEYHDLWLNSNFIRMFRSLLARDEVRTRLLTFPDGERRLTNVLHLSEVLHQEAMERKLGMTGLLKWLSDERIGEMPRLAEHQLRLESDEHAVKVVTMHKSKGLEYPVVFCPFLWDGSRMKGRSGNQFTFHDEQSVLTLDIGSHDQERNRLRAERELLAENIRLMYVALTRAKYRCYTVWGRVNDAGTSAMAYLFHHPRPLGNEAFMDEIEASFQNLNDDALRESLQQFEREAGGAIHLQEISRSGEEKYVPLPGDHEALGHRTFSGGIDRTWKLSSFSSLTAAQGHGGDSPPHGGGDLRDYDQETPGEPVPEEVPAGIFAFPRGTKAGTFMHDLLENADFAEKDGAVMQRLVEEKLRQYGFECSWQGTIADMLTRVLSLPLRTESNTFTLSCIQKADRISELEFCFPLQTISPDRLKRIFSASGSITGSEQFPQRLGSLIFEPSKGFMKGFIDLVFRHGHAFYLVDWKSNYLGNKVEDYHRGALEQVMEEHYYLLQYHLCAVALHQYLSTRLPGYQYERHFGGVYYLFLRGIDPEMGAEYGVYRAKPSEALIGELCENLIAR